MNNKNMEIDLVDDNSCNDCASNFTCEECCQIVEAYYKCRDCLYWIAGHCAEYNGASVNPNAHAGPCFTPRKSE